MGWGADGTAGNYRATVPTKTINPMAGVTRKKCSECGKMHPQSSVKITTPQEIIDEVVETHVEKTYTTPSGIVKNHPPHKLKQLAEKAIRMHVKHTFTCYYCLGIKTLPSVTDEIEMPEPTVSNPGGIAVHICEQDSIGFCTICGVWML